MYCAFSSADSQGLGFMYSLGIGVNASQAKVSHTVLQLTELPIAC